MTDGSLKLKETDRTSRSYTEMTSTFPWHQRVIAFCQWTTLSGSYVAFRRSVCSIIVESLCPTDQRLSRIRAHNRIVSSSLRALIPVIALIGASACASTGAVPQPFPTPGGAARTTPRPPPESAGALPADPYAISGTALALRGTPYRN